MKKNSLYIIFSYLLLINILFSQVAIGFFHNHHGEDQRTEVHKDLSVLKKKSEYCKVCSLDIFHELFFSPKTEFSFSVLAVSDYQFSTIDFKGFNPSQSQSRAPPVSISF